MDEDELGRCISAVLDEHPQLMGMAVVAIDGKSTRSGVAGVADPEGRRLTVDTPVRIASVTKTFVAATVMRLVEQGILTLDDSLELRVAPNTSRALRGGGYDPSLISLRQVLMHVGGLADHADENGLEPVLEDPQRRWTRLDQIRNMLARAPLGPPGTGYAYSDTGYVLLGEVIERATQKTLAASVREACQLDDLGLSATAWERTEPAPERPRAHQYLSGIDITDWDPSIDLYGGGGLVSSARDLASFMRALGSGQVLSAPESLAVMIEAPGQVSPGEYRIGLTPDMLGGQSAFGHGGFWGVNAAFVPALGNLGVAGFVLEKEGYPLLQQIMGVAVSLAARG